jgi:diguanylate cyclase
LQGAVSLIERAEQILSLGETETVGVLLERATLLAHGNRAQRGRILALKVTLHRTESRYDEAARCAKEAIALFRELGNIAAEVGVRSQVARLFLAAGNAPEALTEALSAMEDAQQITEREAQLPVLVECLRALAYVFVSLEQYDQAIAFCERGAESARLLGDVISEGVLLDCIGCAYGAMAYRASATGDLTLAARLVERSIESSREAMMLARAGGHRRYEATALANAAEGLVQSGRPHDALALMAHWPADAPSKAETLISHRLDTQGTICMALGRTAEAIDHFGAALRIASSSDLALAACEHLADACEQSGDLATALAHHKQLHALYKRVASEAAQRSASVAAVQLESRETRARLEEHRAIAAGLQRSNESLNRRADDLLLLSRHDPLTGLANRRLMEELHAENPSGFGIVMIDIDHFKAINDGWSHIVGDAVLRHVAIVIGRCCRSSDTAVRYGGDEFAILVKRDDERSTSVIAERVRAEVESFDWNSVAERLTVSVSVGCSSWSNEGSASALAIADRRLYTAKRAGRNRVATDDANPQG